MYIQTLTIILFFASFISFIHPAMASRVEVVNENKRPVKIQITAEDNNPGENIATYNQEIPGEYYFSFWVVASELKGKSHYSIKGYTNAFTPGSKCDHLNVEKNYKVTFLNNALTCVAEEIQ